VFLCLCGDRFGCGRRPRYEMESAFWDWEEAETLLRHYEGLRVQWT